MAAQYRPNLPFSVPLLLLKPSKSNVVGVHKKTYDINNGILIYGTFKTFGGTEKTVDGLLSIEDTADVETWYRPDIKSDCAIALADTGVIYQIINEPENINCRNQFLKFKVQRVKGGA